MVFNKECNVNFFVRFNIMMEYLITVAIKQTKKSLSMEKVKGMTGQFMRNLSYTHLLRHIFQPN